MKLPLLIKPQGPTNVLIEDSAGEWFATLKVDKGDPQGRAEAVRAALEQMAASAKGNEGETSEKR